MPTYPYHCECGFSEDIVKPISEYDSRETCKVCGKDMDKDWQKMKPAVAVYAGHFNHSLGAYIGSKRQEQDVCKRIEERTGSRPEAIGDYVPPHKPVRQSYDLPRGVFDG